MSASRFLITPMWTAHRLMSIDVLIRPTAFLGLATYSFSVLGEAISFAPEQLIADLGTGGTLLVAFYWLVKGIRKQDHAQTRELTSTWQQAFEKISEAEREAWAAHTELLQNEIQETRADIQDLKNLIIDSD